MNLWCLLLLLVGTPLWGNAALQTCAAALAEKGLPGGPDLGTPVSDLKNRGLIDSTTSEHFLNEGSMGWVYRIVTHSDTSVLKYFTPDGRIYRECEIEPENLEETRARYFEEDVAGYRLFEEILPEAGSLDSFGAVRLLKVDREKKFLILSNASGRALKKVIRQLGKNHPVALRLNESYTQRLRNVSAVLSAYPGVTDVIIYGTWFPELHFEYRGSGYSIEQGNVLVDTENHTMVIFDPV